ncbi:MAG: glycosyltransferase family A protein [Flavobacteriales bacterium]
MRSGVRCSVVIPVFNKGPFLRECLDSVFAQTFRDFEVIAVDDASTDDSLAILRSYNDPRSRIIASERNQGPGMAAQLAMDAASGDIIFRVDADDVLMPDRFQRQLDFMAGHTEVGACGSQMLLLDQPGIWQRNATNDAACKAQLLFGVAMFQPTIALRRDVLLEHRIRYAPEWPRYGEDWLFQTRLAEVTRFANVDEPLVYYRQGPQNTVHGRDRWADLCMLFTAVFASQGLPAPSEVQLTMHAMAVKYFRHPPDAATVRAFSSWLDELAAWNKGEGRFDRIAFQDRLERAWNELFPYLPGFGAAPTWAWFRAGGAMTPARLYYWMRSANAPGKKAASIAG